MKLKKIALKSDKTKQEIAIEQEGNWKLIENSGGDFLEILSKPIAEVQKNYQFVDYQENDYQEVLPFQPSAYRDYMLYEKHAINAVRGFIKKYLPSKMPIINLYEKLTKKTFPKLKPYERYYKYPIYYLGNHLNFMSEGDEISRPEYTQELDYELEIAAVINKPLKNAKPEEVNDAIAGFLILNDFSSRDTQMDEFKAGFGPMKSKNFGSALSAMAVSAEELLPKIDDLKVEVLINDKSVATGHSGGKIFSLQEAIAYASWEEQLHPGEVFGSGTIPDCTGIENGQMLKKGDTITLKVEHIGTLTNIVK